MKKSQQSFFKSFRNKKLNFRELSDHALSRISEWLSGSEYNLHSCIEILARISRLVDVKDRYCEKRFFVKRVKEMNVHDVYKTIVTGEITDKKLIGVLKGLYVFLEVVDSLNQKFSGKPGLKIDFKFFKDRILLNEHLNVAGSLILALVAAVLSELRKRKDNVLQYSLNSAKENTAETTPAEAEKLITISVDSSGIPYPVHVRTLSFKDIENYFSEFVKTEPV